jgi:putative Ca2+/H+ antiporter (TMEM165/GDT1 family)
MFGILGMFGAAWPAIPGVVLASGPKVAEGVVLGAGLEHAAASGIAVSAMAAAAARGMSFTP